MYGLEFVCNYIPNNQVSISKLQNILSITDAELHTILDIHHLDTIAVEPEFRADQMLYQAVKKLFDSNPIEPEKVGLILHTHSILQFSPYLFDPYFSILQDFGLAHARMLSVANLNCAGLDFLFHLARQWLIRHDDVEGILLLFSDKTFIPSFRYLKGCSVMGDAASAAYITRSYSNNRLIGSAINVTASIYEGESSTAAEFAWFNRSITMGIIKTLNQLLTQYEVELDQLRLIIPSNINHGLWNDISCAIKLPLDRFYFKSMKDIGHSHNSDPLINLELAIQEGLLEQGDYFVTLTVGMGGTFGCSLFQH